MRTQNQTDLRVDINNKGYERLAREKYNGREVCIWTQRSTFLS